MQHSIISSILGGIRVLNGNITSRLDLIELSHKGVTKGELLRLADYLNLSVGQMAKLLPVTDRTIQRYTRRQRFNRVVSEQILQIAEVAARGAKVFGNKDKFVSWLKAPSPALGNRSASSLLNSRFGIEIVLDELGRIEHGIIS